MLEKGKIYKVKGYTNSWYACDEKRGFLLLENTYYGDETCYLVVRKRVKVHYVEYTNKVTGRKIILSTIKANVYETYDDIITCLQDNNLI